MSPPRSRISDFYGHLEVKNFDCSPGHPSGGCELVNKDWLKNLIDVDVFGHMRKSHQKAAGALMMACAEATLYARKNYKQGELPKVVQTWPGYPRHQNWDTRAPLSDHSWCIAVDFDPSQNPRGKRGKIPLWFVEIFEAWGFEAGLRWKGTTKDPMHFSLNRR